MSFLIGTLSFIMLAVSLFMIMLVLIQRGRGGGLAGAFGGMGGQSAFGTRAGDMFTRITIVLAVVWVLLAGGLGMMMRRDAEASKSGANSKLDDGADSGKKDDSLLDSDGKKDDGPAPVDDASKDKDKSGKSDEAEKSDATDSTSEASKSSDSSSKSAAAEEADVAEKPAPAEKADATKKAPDSADPTTTPPTDGADATTPEIPNDTPASEPNP